MSEKSNATRLADAIGKLRFSECVQAAAELRRLHEVNAELVEAAKRVLSHQRGEDDWVILAVHCRRLEEAIAKATGEQQ